MSIARTAVCVFILIFILYFFCLKLSLAIDTFFQVYILDGLARWNEDRAVAATTNEQQPHSYNHLLHHTVQLLCYNFFCLKRYINEGDLT